MRTDFTYTFAIPCEPLQVFVDRFSSLHNVSAIKEGVIIPNGKIDLIFYKTGDNQFCISLMGLETTAKPIPKQDIAFFFAVSFNPLGLEYILNEPIADILNRGKLMPDDFWGFDSRDLDNFELFCQKVSKKILSLVPEKIDERKKKLFELIFAADGEISIKELSEKIFWSQRQVNRYFNKQFGLSLKAYCEILRFQASLSHIKEGNLYPQLNFTDQSHFIKEIRKLSGVSPKELFKNQNDRFLQFLVYDKK
jgi:AraC-like DNA-binding protein